MPDIVIRRLVARLRAGDGIAFEKLYSRYNQKLFNFANKLLRSRTEAEGVVQNTFTRIWEIREQLDESHSFSGYLFTIARNDIYNLFRKRINERYYREYLHEYLEKLENTLEEKIIFSELENLTEALIESLPERRKEIFRLSREQGLTYKEIAEELDISENTVDTQIRKALDFLRQKLREKYLTPTR